MLEGKFVPRGSIGKYFGIMQNLKANKKLFDAIKKQKYKMICANDICSENDIEVIKKALHISFDHILPEKCSFEK